MMAAMLSSLVLVSAPLLATPTQAGQAPPEELARPAAVPAPTLALTAYPGLFEAALTLLDSNEHRAAAEAFERAGSCAPHTPVWRVHAGVARLRAGEPDVALEHFVVALEAGYPLDDLVAIAASCALDGPSAAPGVAGVVQVVHAAAERAEVPDAITRSTWHAVTSAGHGEVPFGAEARDHGDLLELAYEGRARRVSDTVGEWLDDGSPLARHEFLDPKSLAVVARIAPPRPAGLGYQLGPNGARTPLPDPRPIWVGATGEHLDQRRFRARVNAEDVPLLDVLTRGLRTGVWVASTRRGFDVSSGDDGTVRISVAAPAPSSARLDVARWRLGAFVSDLMGPPLRPEERPEVHSGVPSEVDAAPVAARVSTLGLRSLTQIADDGPLLAVGSDVVVVLDRRTLEPTASLWTRDTSLVVVAEDGTFLMDAAALDVALVTVGGVRVPARVVAPWLLDPLHVRSLAHDTHRAARRFPVR